MPIRNWSDTAANNASNPPAGAPEGMMPSSVDDTMRQIMADVRAQWENAQFFDFGDTPTFVSATQFTVPGNLTARYAANQRIVASGTGTMGTVYGTIQSSAYGTLTTVTVTWDAGSLDSSLSTVAVGILSNYGMPRALLGVALSGGSADNMPIGATTPAAGHFSGGSITGMSGIDNTPIGQNTAAAVKATTLTSTGTTSLGATSAASLDSTPIGQTTPAAGSFTALDASSNLNVNSAIRATGNNTPASGQGMEVYYTGGIGYAAAVDRTAGSYLPAVFQGSDVTLNANGAGHHLHFNTQGSERGRWTDTGRLLLNTTTDDGSNLVQANGPGKFTGTLSGNGFVPNADNSYTLGTDGLRYTWLCAVNARIGAPSNSASGYAELIGAAGSPVSSRLQFATDNSGWQFRIAKKVSGAVTDLCTFTDSGHLIVNGTADNGETVQANGNVYATGKGRFGQFSGNTYNHGGTNMPLGVANTGTATNSQAHLFIESGVNTNTDGSSFGTVSCAAPALDASNVKAYVGFAQDGTGGGSKIKFATTTANGAAPTDKVIINGAGRTLFDTGTDNGRDVGQFNGSISTTGVYLNGGSTPLSDYEEGTFTPTLAGTSTAGNNTYNTQAGTYTRIGRMVFFKLNILVAAVDANLAGYLEVHGLPYTAQSGSSNNASVDIGYVSGITLSSGYTQFLAEVVFGSTRITLSEYDPSTGSGSSPAKANLGASPSIQIAGSYNI